MAGGIVGSIVGQLAGQLAGGAMQGILGSLMQNFGGGMLGDAISNLFTGKLGEALKGMVDQMPLPSFIKDAVNGLVDSVIGNAQKDGVDSGCQCAVNEAFGQQAEDAAKATAEEIMQNTMQMMSEESRGSCGGSSEGSAPTSWFAALAKAMGEIAGKHLDKMVELSDKMQDLTGKDDAGEMAAVQSEFQAEAQMFKMASEAASTAIKSIGEGLSAMARKQ